MLVLEFVDEDEDDEDDDGDEEVDEKFDERLLLLCMYKFEVVEALVAILLWGCMYEDEATGLFEAKRAAASFKN